MQGKKIYTTEKNHNFLHVEWNWSTYYNIRPILAKLMLIPLAPFCLQKKDQRRVLKENWKSNLLMFSKENSKEDSKTHSFFNRIVKVNLKTLWSNLNLLHCASEKKHISSCGSASMHRSFHLTQVWLLVLAWLIPFIKMYFKALAAPR